MLRAGVSAKGPRSRRRRRLWRRRLRLLGPVAVLVVIAVGVVVVIRAASGRSERRLVTNYVQAWVARRLQRHVLDARPGLPSGDERAPVRRRLPPRREHGDGPQAGGRARRPSARESSIPVQMLVFTRLFGELHETLEVPVTGSGSSATVHFMSSLAFPGLQAHERLSRHMALSPRATLFAADGTPLAQGPDRTSPISDVALQIVGTLGSDPGGRRGHVRGGGLSGQREGRRRRTRACVPEPACGDARRRAGRRQARAGADRPGARARRHDDDRCRRSSAPRSRRSATTTPGSSRWTRAPAPLLALAGIAFSAPQPPGSTMKIITSTGGARGRDREADRRLSVQHRRPHSTATPCTTPAARTAAARS